MVAWWESIVPWKLLQITIYSFNPPHFQSDIAGLLSFNNLPHPLIISRKRFCIQVNTNMQTNGEFCSEEGRNTEARSVATILPTAELFVQTLEENIESADFSKHISSASVGTAADLLLLEIKFSLEEITDRYFPKARSVVCSSAPHTGWQVLSCASPCWDRRELKLKKKKKKEEKVVSEALERWFIYLSCIIITTFKIYMLVKSLRTNIVHLKSEWVLTYIFFAQDTCQQYSHKAAQTLANHKKADKLD